MSDELFEWSATPAWRPEPLPPGPLGGRGYSEETVAAASGMAVCQESSRLRPSSAAVL